MTYYSYGYGSIGWREDRIDQLLQALKSGLGLSMTRPQFGDGLWICRSDHQLARIRIMNTDMLNLGEYDRLTEEADKIYCDIMMVRNC